LGVSIDDLIANEPLEDGEKRVISGSVFHGNQAQGDVLGYLGRYHQQITVLREGREREFLGWLSPGTDKFSVVRTFVSKLMPGKTFDFTTAINGSNRAIVPIGVYEKVFPLDMVPTFLLRSLVMHDVEMAEEFGCLELDEEDVALCSFVCPGKTEYGHHLRQVLTTIEKEG
jgi:Na+-transporting NADH:ubiquinone oxidoreductase subunit A